MTDPETQKRIEETETQLRSILADDIEWHVPGDEGNVVVLNYVVVAKVLDKDGKYSIRYSTSQESTWSDVLGWLNWMKVITEDKIRRANRNA